MMTQCLKISLTYKGAKLKQSTYQKIVNNTLRWIDMQHIKVTVSVRDDINRGRGYFYTKEIMLPSWLYECDPCYRIYYTIHELVHCLIGYAHDKTFKKIEDILLSLWDISIERKSVYPRRLYYNNKEVFNIPHQIKTIRSMLNEQETGN